MNPYKIAAVTAATAVWACTGVSAQPLPGGTLDPLVIPKFVEPLVIPPVMPASPTPLYNYEIALRQITQQVLPRSGCLAARALNPAILCNGDAFPATLQWGYGNPNNPTTFNNPAFTVEATTNVPATVKWSNELVQNPAACALVTDPTNVASCDFLTHVVKDANGLPVIDQTLHWAAPGDNCVGAPGETDCRGGSAQAYLGPVPMVTHVHGAHVGPISDGYPEAWWLPRSGNLAGYVPSGTLFDDESVNLGLPANDGMRGYALYRYPHAQSSATLWYHDHSLGITRLNVYAAGAGFWLLRDPAAISGETGLTAGVLPGPAPVAGDDPVALNTLGNAARNKIREIPIAIQDKAFNVNGSLFFPANRAFFEGLSDGQRLNANTGVNIPFMPDPMSDISPIWNPEAFFNTMVVNGRTWPVLEVAPERYRFRLLNANDSRFLNLALFEVKSNSGLFTNRELPFYQIGAEQGLLNDVVRIQTGFATPLPGTGIDVCTTGGGKPKATGAGNANCVNALAAPDPQQALLVGPAERADVIVDFTAVAPGTQIRMINTAPDAPFGGFPDIPADPATSGQVMEFVVTAALANPAGDPSTPPTSLQIARPGAALVGGTTRRVALLEEVSSLICVLIDAITGTITATGQLPPCTAPALPFAPKATVLGVNPGVGLLGQVTLWDDPIHQNPALNAVETWEMWNQSIDAHPMHLHMVKFEVVNREVIGSGILRPPLPSETGWKDTVTALPNEITRVRMQFDIAGLYVWHCHILSHEDNEMMVPYCVGDPTTDCGGLQVNNTF